MSNEALIILLFFVTNILTGICLGLLDSRNYWKKRWEEDQEYILNNLRGGNNG